MEKYMLSEYNEIEILDISIIDEVCEMYDIEVEEDHTFIITSDNLVSHNCNTLMKAITVPAIKTDTTMIVLNHVYDDPSAMFTQKIKMQSGGKGLQYMASLSIQCTRNLEKETEKEADGYYSGTNLRFFTVKNRLCRPSLEAEIYLDFKKGFVNKYDGLFDEAVRYGFIQCPSQGYFTVPSYDPDKKYRRSQIENNEEIWQTFIKDFDERSMQDLKYSQTELEEIIEAESKEETEADE
jgi:RecA/RadA recombinase